MGSSFITHQTHPFAHQYGVLKELQPFLASPKVGGCQTQELNGRQSGERVVSLTGIPQRASLREEAGTRRVLSSRVDRRAELQAC